MVKDWGTLFNNLDKCGCFAWNRLVMAIFKHGRET